MIRINSLVNLLSPHRTDKFETKLRNIGNTCYINAEMQCISTISYFFEFPDKVIETNDKTDYKRANFIVSVSILIKSLKCSKAKYLVPRDLKYALDIRLYFNI